MQGVEVDVIGLQPTERLLERADDVLAAVSARVGIARLTVVAELRREHHAIACPTIGDEASEPRFTRAIRVAVRRVDEVAAGIEIAIEQLSGGRFV